MYSELDAVNYVLSQVGIAPVTDLSSTLPDIVTAQQRLYESSVWVQKQGMWYNKLICMEGVPDPDTKEIELPDNTLKIMTDYPVFIIAKDGKAFSPLYNSFEFNEPIIMDLVLLLEFDSVPPSVQDCIMYRAAAQHILHELEDQGKAQLPLQDFETAYVQLKSEDLEIKQRNAMSQPVVQRFLSRVRPYKRRSSTVDPRVPGGIS